jgi:hypothetical protein
LNSEFPLPSILRNGTGDSFSGYSIYLNRLYPIQRFQSPKDLGYAILSEPVVPLDLYHMTK